MFKIEKKHSKKEDLHISNNKLNIFSESTEDIPEKVSKNKMKKRKPNKKKLSSTSKNELQGKPNYDEHKAAYYFNYKHLKDKVSGYGYTMTTVTLLQYYAYALIVGFLISRMYKMPVWASVITMMIALIVAIRLIINKYYNLYQVKRFNDANRYIEQMLSSFKRSHLIYESLKNVDRTFSEGEMKSAVKKAMDVLKNSNITDEANEESSIVSNNELKENALSYISEAYYCQRINMMHKFLIIVEKNGGDCNIYLDMLLKDRNLWDRRCQDAQISRNHKRTLFFVSVIVAALICAIPFYLPSLIGDNYNMIDIANFTPIVIGSLIYIIISALFLNSTDKSMCSNWLNDVNDIDINKAQKDYHSYIEFDPKKGAATSLIIAAFVATLVIIIYAINQQLYFLLGGMILVIFLMRIHEFMHRSLYKSLKKKIEIAVPYWIMNVALLLQSQSVRSAIKSSYNDAPNILKPALDELLLGLEEFPDDFKSYDLFLKEFNITEVSECMQILYSLSTGASKDDISLLTDIIGKSTIMMDRSEDLKIKDRTAILGTSIMMPVVFSSIKLIIDLSAFLIMFLLNISMT